MKAASRERIRTFRAALRGGAWQVTRDYVFHSEYPTREDAVRGACAAARSCEEAGGSARVLTTPGDVLVSHRAPAKGPIPPSRGFSGKTPI